MSIEDLLAIFKAFPSPPVRLKLKVQTWTTSQCYGRGIWIRQLEVESTSAGETATSLFWLN